MGISRGNKCYIVVSNMRVEQVEILSCQDGLYMVKFIDSDKVIRVKRHRLYDAFTEAENAIPVRIDERTRRNPWGV